MKYVQRKAALAAAVLGLSLGTGCSHLKMGMFMFNSNPSENDPASIARGREAFEKNCASCHGIDADGKGTEAAYLGTPPTNFRAPDYSKAAIRLAAHISYGKGSDMPGFSEKLPYQTVWDIANYLHSLQRQS